jgi:hypothetical protein
LAGFVAFIVTVSLRRANDDVRLTTLADLAG